MAIIRSIRCLVAAYGFLHCKERENMNCVCSGCTCYIGVYHVVYGVLYGSVWWGLEDCAHLLVGGVCVAEVHGGGLRCWGGLCVFVIKSLHRLWVFSVVVRLDSGNGCVV